VNKKHYICCHACDEVAIIKEPEKEGVYKCPNCGHTLFKNRKGVVEKLYALSIASLILFILSNIYPILTFSVLGKHSTATFSTAIEYLYKDGDYIMAIAVLMTTIVVPLLYITISMILFGMLYYGFKSNKMIYMTKILEDIKHWGMLDVFMVGILVSVVKLVKMGTIHFGISFYSFIALIPIMAYSHMILDTHKVWEKMEELGIRYDGECKV